MGSRSSDEVEQHRRAPVVPLLESGLHAQLVASYPRDRAGEDGLGSSCSLGLDLGLVSHPREEPVIRSVFVAYLERDKHSTTQGSRTEN